tara:strand:- start:885 stop:1013 length:129 start_codon:yes stop_codon:yes gene_type:complete
MNIGKQLELNYLTSQVDFGQIEWADKDFNFDTVFKKNSGYDS